MQHTQRSAENTQQSRRRRVKEEEQQNERRAYRDGQIRQREADRNSQISQKEAGRNRQMNHSGTDRNRQENQRGADRHRSGLYNTLSNSNSQRLEDDFRSHGRMQLSKNYVANHYHPQSAPNCPYNKFTQQGTVNNNFKAPQNGQNFPYYQITQQGTINNNFMAPPQNGLYGQNGPVYTAPPLYSPNGDMTPQTNPYGPQNGPVYTASSQIQAHMAPKIPGLHQFGPYAPQNAQGYMPPPPYDPYGQMALQNGQPNNHFHAETRQNVQFRPQSGRIAPPSVHPMTNQQPTTSLRQRDSSRVEDDDDFIVEMESL